jgi:hypothetical protein
MKMLGRRAAFGFVMLCAVSASARGDNEPVANSLDVTYFSVVEDGDPDFNTTACCLEADQLVEPMLGPNGLPVLNRFYGISGTSSYVVHDVNNDGEIGWWTPGTTIKFTGAGLALLPIQYSTFFPPNGSGTGDLAGFQTAVFHGVLHLPQKEAVKFTLGVNDVAFVYIDGVLVADIGGVRQRVDSPIVTNVLPAGDHCFALFYADNYPLHAELTFSIDTPDVTAQPSSKAPTEVESDQCSVPIADAAPRLQQFALAQFRDLNADRR